MMNRIGRGNEEWVSSPEPWVRGPQGGGPGPGARSSGPGGTKVRGSRWRSATGRSYGRRRLAGSGWTRASAPPARKPGATCVAHARTPAPGSAPPPGSVHLPVAPTSRLRPPPGRGDQPVCWSDTMQARSTMLLLATAREGGGPVRAGGWRRRGRACTSCLSRTGRAGCGRPF